MARRRGRRSARSEQGNGIEVRRIELDDDIQRRLGEVLAALNSPPPTDQQASQHARRLFDILAQFEGDKIITGQGTCPGRMVSFNFDMTGAVVTSTSRQHALTLLGRTYQHGSINVRQFTSEIHAASGMPIKNLYGYFIIGGDINRISPQGLEAAHNTDSDTGRPLSPEPAVRYL
jgi:hypothetical protein